MPFIQWKQEMSVSVAGIDAEHKKMIVMLNKLFDAMHEGHSKEIVRPILEDLVSYAKLHFATEEKYFQQFNYANTEEHVREHRKFIDNVNKFIRDYKTGKIGLSLEILNFLKQWLSDHILGSDKKYIECFNSHGLK